MAIGSISAFRATGTSILNAGTSSASVALAGGGESVVVTNNTSSLGFVKFSSDATVTASTTDMPVLPYSRVLLSINGLISYAAALLTAGSGSLYFTRGDGSVV